MNAGENHLLQLLSNNDVTFFIPPYQRNYEWDESQCEIFFNDIKKVTQENVDGEESEHFVGTVVYVEDEAIFGEPSKLVLIDGQQRITTTMLFLVAVRDVVKDEKSKEFINKRYLKNDNVSGELEYKIKLKQVESDWEAYRNIILENNLTDVDKQSVVYQNYQYFMKQLNKVREEGDIQLTELVSKGLEKFSVVTIQLQPKQNKWENPQEIFESMNSIGKPLSLADLVRNYLLLGQSPNEQNRLYKDYWLFIEKQLPKQVSNFIRDFMQLKSEKDFKKATEKNYKGLYAIFKKMHNEDNTENLLYELNKYAGYYAYIVYDKTSGVLSIDKKLSDLRKIGVTIANSFILGLINRWKNNELNEIEMYEILDVLFIYFLRRRISVQTRGENKSIPQLAGKIDEIVHASDKREKMFFVLSNQGYSTRLPNNNDITTILQSKDFYSIKQASFILSLMEEKITKSRPNSEDRNLQIEHIMPQTLNEEWMEELGESYEKVHQEYVNNIGNLTLIRHNAELGNKPFTEKKEVYRHHAGLQIAKTNIIDCSVWNENSIQNRCKWMINYLVNDVLPIPEVMKNKSNYSPKQSRRFSFQRLNLIGEEINYMTDPSIIVKVVNDREVEFEGERWKLSPLTREIETRKGTVNKSGSYAGPTYWEFEGKRLSEIESRK